MNIRTPDSNGLKRASIGAWELIQRAGSDNYYDVYLVSSRNLVITAKKDDKGIFNIEISHNKDTKVNITHFNNKDMAANEIYKELRGDNAVQEVRSNVSDQSLADIVKEEAKLLQAIRSQS